MSTAGQAQVKPASASHDKFFYVCRCIGEIEINCGLATVSRLPLVEYIMIVSRPNR